jgi:hypothetical protein
MRINLLIPGPINSPQRAKTHPGEAKDILPQLDDLLPNLLYLMGPESADVRGKVFFGSSHAPAPI